MADEDTKLEVLYDHYKDSFGFLQHYRKERDWLFVLLVVALILMLFQLSAPSQSGQAISEAASTWLGLASRIDISFLGSVIWLALLGLLLRYCQTVVTMERQYKYIHALEELLSGEYASKAFTREGKSYLADYPLLSRWASFFYTLVFPVLLLAVASARIAQELAGSRVLSAVLAFDAIAYLAVLTSAVLYLISIHRPKEKKGTDKEAAA